MENFVRLQKGLTKEKWGLYPISTGVNRETSPLPLLKPMVSDSKHWAETSK